MSRDEEGPSWLGRGSWAAQTHLIPQEMNSELNPAWTWACSEETLPTAHS